MSVISSCRWTKAHPELEYSSRLSLQACIAQHQAQCGCERPIDGEHRLRIQTRHASDSGACNGTEAGDKELVYVLSGPAGVKFYPTLSSQACAQCEYEDSGSLCGLVISSSKCQRGQLWLEEPRLLLVHRVHYWQEL